MFVQDIFPSMTNKYTKFQQLRRRLSTLFMFSLHKIQLITTHGNGNEQTFVKIEGQLYIHTQISET